jgi:hypothetical protein
MWKLLAPGVGLGDLLTPDMADPDISDYEFDADGLFRR